MAFPPSKQTLPGLPDPDLTPSLNPTLARNLGRWAEVYFTTPPEERDAAVQKLLHELQEAEQKRLGRWNSDAAPAPTDPVQPAAAETPQFSTTTDRTQSLAIPAPESRTETAELATPATADSHRSSFVEILRTSTPRFEPPVTLPAPPLPTEVVPAWNGAETAQHPLLVDAGAAAVEVATQQETSDAESAASAEEVGGIVHPAVDSQPGTSRPLRMIATFAAALVLLVVIRTAMIRRGAGPTFSTLPPSTNVAGPPAQERASSKSAPAQTAPAQVTATNAGSGSQILEAAASREGVISSATNPKLDASLELAMAERYRMGKGVPQDSAQAARWLWQAVAKENGDALERLAGMYATGDGVPRDCDQARVLAGAASRKLPQNADRLTQELRAAGCE